MNSEGMEPTVKPLTRDELITRTDQAFVSFYLTLISVVQGVAFSYLLFDFFSHKPAGTVTFYHVITFGIIVLVSFEYVALITFLRWPLSFLDILIPLGLGVGQVAPLAYCAKVSTWWWAVAGLAICGVFGYVHSMCRAGDKKFEGGKQGKPYRLTVRNLRISGITCFLLSVLAVVLAFIQPGSWWNTVFLWVFSLSLIGLIINAQVWFLRMYWTYDLPAR